MGGLGSGSWNPRPSTASALRLDVRMLYRDGFLAPDERGTYTWRYSGGRSSSIALAVTGDDQADTLHIAYNTRGGDAVTQHVPLEWTPCNFGGARPWALCPLCDRRIAVLWSRGRFACRQCHDLAYQSTRMDRADRYLEKARAIRIRLGGSGDMTQPVPWKPTGMHWRTYWRLREEERQAHVEALRGWIVTFEGMAARLGVEM